jgi:serine/threonine protein kinase
MSSTGGPDAGGSFAVESLWQAIGQLSERNAADPLLGRSLGEVTLTRFIAEGGMGRVYEAEQSNPPRRVAVKLLRPGLIARETIRRFVREVSTLGSLRHPWITQIFSAGTYEVGGAELPYFVMELIPDALPITEYVMSRNLSLTERLRLFRQVCDAIAYGHRRGIVHRDLKPSNLLVDGLGHPKVIDFGVACGPGAGDRVTTLTDTGQLIGTLQYMSPEQAAGQSAEVDSRADVYSLGVVLYELLAGQPPHPVRGLPFAQAARIIHEQRPKPVRSINTAVPRQVAGIVEKCLNKNAHYRYSTAAELSVALGNVGNAASGLRGVVAGYRLLSSSYSRIMIAVLASASLILGTVYFMPPIEWPSISLKSVKPASTALRGVGGTITVRRPNIEAGADPQAALMLQSAEIHRDDTTFRFVLCDVHQKNADAFLVEKDGMKKWMDQFMFPRVSYWAPEVNGVEGVLVYRFDLGAVAESIHIQAISNCWDFFHEPGGVGRGASAIEISRDGKDWVAIEDNIEPRRWGATITVDKDLPQEFIGIDTLWVRVRCITESAPIDNGYNVAQFSRTRPGRQEPAFVVSATFREKELGPTPKDRRMNGSSTTVSGLSGGS